MVESIGMKVNAEKTTMVCFSDSVGYTTDAYIEEGDAVRIHCQDSMNVLGMRFSFWADRSVRPRSVDSKKPQGKTDCGSQFFLKKWFT